MSDQDLAKLAASALAEATPAAIEPSAAQRSAAIDAIRGAMRTRATNRLRTRLTWFAAAAAVVLISSAGLALGLQGLGPRAAAGGVVARAVSGSALISTHELSGTVANGMAVDEGARITTPRGAQLGLEFATGSRVEVGEATDLTLEETKLSQRLFLASGQVHVQVAKVKPGAHFIVATRDAQVEVRGTEFSVEVVPADPSCGEGSTTRVAVTEGQVRVQHHGALHLVNPGQRWPDCGVTAAAPVPAAAAAPAATSVLEAVKAPAPVKGSTLAEQNDLLEKAVALRNDGDPQKAVAVFEALMRKYPGAPLAESAAVERMTTLHDLDPKRGAQAAAEYLKAYPNGFAREEAEKLRSEHP
jgi:hypothetical protein